MDVQGEPEETDDEVCEGDAVRGEGELGGYGAGGGGGGGDVGAGEGVVGFY